MSDDCLYINVVAPPPGRPPSPVLVYFHAGEFHYGAGADEESDQVYTMPDVVYVTFNYRLGAFGFLASEDLRRRAPNNGTGNYGMLDQREALRWVQKYIAEYGGNASNVALWGESSGGTSVAYHLVSPASHGLYNKAILESPGLTQIKPMEDAELNYQYTLAALLSLNEPQCVRRGGYLELPRTLRYAPRLGGGTMPKYTLALARIAQSPVEDHGSLNHVCASAA